jgi:hypothetical protein
MELPVQVGEADAVVVDEYEMPHAGADESFHGVGSDAADAEDRNAASPEFLERLASDQQFGSRKGMQPTGHPSSVLSCFRAFVL